VVFGYTEIIMNPLTYFVPTSAQYLKNHWCTKCSLFKCKKTKIFPEI